MARTHTFRFDRRIDAPVGVVWRLLVEHEAYSRWTPVPSARLVAPGAEDPNGVGAVRFLGVGPLGTREAVVAFTPEEHLAYGITSGLPVRNHRADVHLTADGGGTRLVYEGRFEPALPLSGHVVAAIMNVAIRTLIRSLDRAAVRAARTPG